MLSQSQPNTTFPTPLSNPVAPGAAAVVVVEKPVSSKYGTSV